MASLDLLLKMKVMEDSRQSEGETLWAQDTFNT